MFKVWAEQSCEFVSAFGDDTKSVSNMPRSVSVQRHSEARFLVIVEFARMASPSTRGVDVLHKLYWCLSVVFPPMWFLVLILPSSFDVVLGSGSVFWLLSSWWFSCCSWFLGFVLRRLGARCFWGCHRSNKRHSSPRMP